MIALAVVLMAGVLGVEEKPARIVETNGVPTILINKAAKDFKVGQFEPGETYTTFFAKTNAAGEVAEVSAVPSMQTVGDIFSSRVGMRYVPRGAEAWSATGETPVAPVNGAAPDGQDARRPSGEILREIPKRETPLRLKGWERPRFVFETIACLSLPLALSQGLLYNMWRLVGGCHGGMQDGEVSRSKGGSDL